MVNLSFEVIGSKLQDALLLHPFSGDADFSSLPLPLRMTAGLIPGFCPKIDVKAYDADKENRAGRFHWQSHD
jgi:hypothetical protein